MARRPLAPARVLPPVDPNARCSNQQECPRGRALTMRGSQTRTRPAALFCCLAICLLHNWPADAAHRPLAPSGRAPGLPQLAPGGGRRLHVHQAGDSDIGSPQPLPDGCTLEQDSSPELRAAREQASLQEEWHGGRKTALALRRSDAWGLSAASA